MPNAKRPMLLVLIAVLAGLLTTVGVAGFAFLLTTPAYQATARMLLILPADARREPDNPFFYLPDGLEVMSAMVAETMQHEVSGADLANAGMASQFEVALDRSEPIITISVEGTDPDEVIAARDWLVGFADGQVRRIQEEVGAPIRQMARMHVFMDNEVAHPIGGSRMRAVVGVVAAGAILTATAASFVTGRVRRTPAVVAPELPLKRHEEGAGLREWHAIVLYVVALFCIPTRLVVGPVGAVGSPANLFAIALLLWWCCALLGGHLSTMRRNGFRISIALLTSAVFASYAAGHLQGWYQPADVRPMSGGPGWQIADVPTMTEMIGSASDRGLLTFAGWIGIALVTSEGIRNWGELHRVLNWVVGAATFVAGLGVIQYFTGLNVASLIQIPGLSAHRDFGSAIARSELHRVVSTSTHPIELAVIMAALLPLALHIGFHSRRLSGWIPTILIGVTSLMTVSRSGIVVAAVAMLVMFVGWPMKRRLLPIMAAPAIIVVGPVVLPGLLGTIRALFTNLGNDPSIAARTDDFGVVSQLFAEQPLFGRGLMTFVTFVYRTLDNQILVLLLEVGVLGLLAFGAVALTAFLQSIAVHRRATNERQRHAGLAIAAGLAGVLTSYVTFDTLGFKQAAGLTFLLMGLGAAAWRLTKRDRTDENAAVSSAAEGRQAWPMTSESSSGR